MRALSPTSDGKNGKEGRDRGVSKYTNEYLGSPECLVEKQVHKRKIALTTAIMLFYVFLMMYLIFLEHIFIAGFYNCSSLLNFQEAPQKRSFLTFLLSMFKVCGSSACKQWFLE